MGDSLSCETEINEKNDLSTIQKNMGNSLSCKTEIDEKDDLLTICDKYEEASNGKLSLIVEKAKKQKITLENINDTNDDGRTMLYCASRNGKYNVVQWLVENGADINCLESHGSTPLHSASYYGHTLVVQYLVGLGCDRTIKNQWNLLASDEAKNELIKNLILYPKRGCTQRFTVNKHNLPALLTDVRCMACSQDIHYFDRLILDSFEKDKLKYKQIDLKARELLSNSQYEEEELKFNDVDVWRESCVTRSSITCESSFYKLVIKEISNFLPQISDELNNIYNEIINNVKNNKIQDNLILFKQFYNKIIEIYTMESIIYKQMNSDIASRNQLTKLKYYSRALDYGIHKFCKFWNTVCYRNVTLSDDQIKLFDIQSKNEETSGLMALPHFSSASKDINVALKWGGNAILAIMPSRRGKPRAKGHCGAFDISSLSIFPNEQEVLIPYRNQYYCRAVININTFDDKKFHMAIGQMYDSDNDFLADQMYAAYKTKPIIKIIKEDKSTNVTTMIVCEKGWESSQELGTTADNWGSYQR